MTICFPFARRMTKSPFYLKITCKRKPTIKSSQFINNKAITRKLICNRLLNRKLVHKLSPVRLPSTSMVEFLFFKYHYY